VSDPGRWESETLASQAGGVSKLPLLTGAGVGVVVAIGLAFLFWPASEGRIVFQLDPPDAEVAVLLPEARRILAGSAAGATTVLESGRHRAEVSAPGYETAAVEFEVVGGELRNVAVALEPLLGSVVFEIEPDEARVQVTALEGGDPRELPLVEGRWQGNLEIGEYVARISASGYHEESIPFAVSAEEPALLPVTLRAAGRSAAPRARDPVVVPAPRYYGPRYYGPRYYGPR
jgi:hypothetical protein